jgi:uncharacterized OsmC-like protein
MTARAKEHRYAVDLEPDGMLRDDKGTPLDVPLGWTPEHLLLAALLRCTLKSLRHHAVRAGIGVDGATASGRALVTRRERDGRYAQVEAELELVVDLTPRPSPGELADLLAKAERDCFVGASLDVEPTYRWTINGTPV